MGCRIDRLAFPQSHIEARPHVVNSTMPWSSTGRTRPGVMRLLSARARAVTTNSGLVRVPAILGMDEIVQLAHDRLSVPY
jgi:hypothetical protein